MGTAGIDATMLRAGWPEGQVPLLAADRVVALALGEGAPISEPLIGWPAGARGSATGRQGHSGGQWRGYRISRGSGLEPSVYKRGNIRGLGRGSDLHKGTQQFRGRIRLRF